MKHLSMEGDLVCKESSALQPRVLSQQAVW